LNEKYKCIIDLPHHTSKNHASMARGDRAAQFAPYSALSGYEDAVGETARRTECRIELDEYEKEKINARLIESINSPTEKQLAITFFLPDGKKSGGAYVRAVGCIGRIDEIKKEITLQSGRVIQIEEIIEIEVVGDE
jgi:hypothetical protein